MKPGFRIAHVILRTWEFMCSMIVVALLGRFLRLADEGGAVRDSRIVYGVALAAISLAFSLLFGPPFIYAFLAFPADFILFAAWMTAFGLMIARTGINTCNSPWYWNYWGYYWGRAYLFHTIQVFGPDLGCNQWRTVLAFSFLAGFAFLISSILGAVAVITHYKGDDSEPKNVHSSSSQTATTGQSGSQQLPSSEASAVGNKAA
ncbi:hypothetical protein B0T19DRAFT_493415 [Cercophora scortea]|uniref:MARVEL domain-containing protein n=1 Tax=Cercophora scortea TaxID=314031 RepID=A0AAE0M3H5_9PEZI|nr:hypothetical protein B0T19DRAFT_493415 [Cercophora scortea]